MFLWFRFVLDGTRRSCGCDRRRFQGICYGASGLWGLSTLLGAMPPAAGAGFDATARTHAAASITSTELNSHLSLLAGDSLEGREAGSRGGYTAGNYLVHHLQTGLVPAGDPGQFYQPFGESFRNVLAVLPGADASLRHEYILIGAHYDHVGYGSRQNSQGPWGVVHNGADDNASGTSALLEVIQAFVSADVRPRRSILFAFWDGEEKGLLGSEHWAHHPTVPWEQIRLTLNADMVGRLNGKSLEIQGTRTVAGLRRLVTQANRDSDLPIAFNWSVESNSDHYTFFKRQVPFVMFHTGLHADYHRPSDDVEQIDWEGLQSVSRLIFNLAVLAADQDECGAFRQVSEHESEQRRQDFERAMPLPAPRLGIRWEPHQASEPNGVRVVSVNQPSAAARGGLKAGDIISAINGQPLLASSTLQQLAVTQSRLQLQVWRQATSGNVAGSGAGRDGGGIAAIDDPPVSQSISLPIDLEGPPQRLGISWRDDVADPESVTLVSVIPHSVCDQAGLRVGDRVWQLDGRPFRDSAEFMALTRQVELPASVLVERQGRLLELRIPSLP